MAKRYLIVGVRESSAAIAALQWAVDEAVLRGCDVVAAHGTTFAYGQPPLEGPLLDDLVRDQEAFINRLLARVVVPAQVRVYPVAEIRHSVAMLRDRAEDAELLVVGRHHSQLLHRMTQGSVIGPLTTSVRCPMVIVPPYGDRRPGPAAPIVVALDGETSAETALGFGFTESALRRAPLRVLHSHQGPHTPEAVAGEVRNLAEILAGWQADWPDVDVQIRVVPGDPAAVVEHWTTGALMMVVGRPHHIHLGGWSRSVVRAVLGVAACPLVVAPPSPRSAGPSPTTPKKEVQVS